MTFLDTMFQRAKSDVKTLVLAEGNDPRTYQAARVLVDEGIAKVIIVATDEELAANTVILDGITIMNPETSDLAEELTDSLCEIRKNKGLTRKEAAKLILDRLYFGVMLVKQGYADGMVAGAYSATSDVLRPSLQILKTKPGIKLASSFFVMIVPDCPYGQDGTFIFSDCGLEVQPDAERLANIAVGAAGSWKQLLGTEPRVALLSHSTYGSAKNDDAKKVIEATAMAKQLAPALAIDGELQLDAAIIPEIGAAKAPDSPIAGKANVLIFPDLDAGNIGYKLVQRLAHAEAYGPITQGLRYPVNDLSRGCSAEDIVAVAAITCVQAQMNEEPSA